MDLETIELTRDGRVAVIELSRPARLNAWTPRMARELFETLAALDDDDDVRAIVVTGAGRAFCAGADLDPSGDTFAAEGKWHVGDALVERTHPWNLRTPVIGAINGPAVGIGATLPLGFDLRFAAAGAKIGFVFTRRGIVPEATSSWILPRLVGLGAAMDLMLSGRILRAEEARELGLIDRIYPPEELMDATLTYARELAERCAPVSVAIAKRLLWRHLSEPSPARAKAREDALLHWAGNQPDAAEGVKSFLEKRTPEWAMRVSEDFPEDLFEDG